jgi:hypothetical protein
MIRNMSLADRIIRIMIVALIGVLYFMNIIKGIWAVALLLIAIILLLTAIVGNCPLYTFLGISSSRSLKRKQSQ